MSYGKSARRAPLALPLDHRVAAGARAAPGLASSHEQDTAGSATATPLDEPRRSRRAEEI